MAKRGFSPEDVITELKEQMGSSPPAPPPDPSTLGVPPAPRIGETYNGALEDAATLLINMFTPSLKTLLIELADITLKLPRWQLIMGSVLAQYESGTLAAPSIDPAWRNVEAIIGDSICEECKKIFIPKRVGQRFCSNACGDVARKREIEKVNKRRDEIRAAELRASKEASMEV